MNNGKHGTVSLGLLLLIALALFGAPTAAYPGRTTACDGCHRYPAPNIDVTTSITAITVNPGETFSVTTTYVGGADDGQTAIKWPSGVLNNALFNPTPVMSTAVIDTSGSLTSTLTAPATVGTYTVRVYATTGGSLFETDYQNIAVTVQASPPPDTTAPVITITGANPVDVVQNSVYTDAGATATDNVDPVVTVNAVSTVNTAVIGTYTVTYTATDAAGNVASAVRVVNVVLLPDTEAPIITIIGNNPETVFVGSVYTDAGATAVDDVDGDLTASIAVVSNVNTAVEGTYPVVYSVSDAAGNTAAATRTVNVVAPPPPPDTTPPVITVLGANPVDVVQGSTYTDAGATATDDVDGPVAVQTTGAVDTVVIGTYTITYTAADVAGNIATAARTVNVVAIPPPPPTTPPDDEDDEDDESDEDDDEHDEDEDDEEEDNEDDQDDERDEDDEHEEEEDD